MNIADSHELKSLQVRRTKAQAEVAELLVDVKAANKKHGDAVSRLSDLDRRIAVLQEIRKEPVVSEHALLRYIERVMGLDLEQVKRDILSTESVAKINSIVSGKIQIIDGYKLVIKDRTVVTVE